MITIARKNFWTQLYTLKIYYLKSSKNGLDGYGNKKSLLDHAISQISNFLQKNDAI